MIELAIAIAAALYTARFVVREASPPPRHAARRRRSARRRRAPALSAHPVTIPAEPEAEAMSADGRGWLEFDPIEDPAATQAIDVSSFFGEHASPPAPAPVMLPAEILPGAGTLPAGARPAGGVETVGPHPDPERLIQTEVVLATGPAARTAAFARLFAGVAFFGLVLGLVVLAFVRVMQTLIAG